MRPSSMVGGVVCVVLLAVAVGPARAADRSAVISLASGTIDVREPAAVAEGLDVAAAGAGAESYVLVKFPGPVTAQQLAALERASERVYTYLPHDDFLVRARPKLVERLEGGGLGAVWSGPYHPAYKLSPAAAARRSRTGAETPRQVLIHVFPDAELDAVVARIAELTGAEAVASRRRERFSRRRLRRAAGRRGRPLRRRRRQRL